MIKRISGNELQSLIHNYTENKDLPFYTDWGVVMMGELVKFIKSVEDSGANAIAIALIRFPLVTEGPASGNGKPRIKSAGMGLSQVSFALIPGDTMAIEPWPMNAKQEQDELFNVLCVCPPGSKLKEDDLSGLCPPQGSEIGIPGI